MKLSSILKHKSKKGAIIVSYCSLLLNTLSSIFLTRFLLQVLGADEYGLYQMVNSVAQYVLILDLGIATVMVRYISEYRARSDIEGERNIASIIALFATAGIVLVIIIGFVLRARIGFIYSSLTQSEVLLSQKLITIMIGQFVLTIINHYFVGAVQSYERFLYSSIISIVSIIILFFLTIVLVKSGIGCIGISLANLSVICLQVLINGTMAVGVLKFRVRLTHWDQTLVRPVLGLMLAMLLQSVIANVNSSVDKTLLGMFCIKEDVTKYALAATVLTMYNTVPGIVSGYFQPQITRMIVNKATPSELTDVVIRVGRWQFMIVGAIFGAFLIFGQDFVALWTSNLTYSKIVWLIVIIIMPTNMIPLIQTVCISIMNGYDKRLVRSLILLVMTGINIVVTIVFIKQFGPLGAPIGTTISYLIGNGFALNLYYSKKLKLEVSRMFGSIIKNTWIAIAISVLLCIPFMLIKNISILKFVLECICFVVIYGVCMLLFGLNKEEKQIVKGIIKLSK